MDCSFRGVGGEFTIMFCCVKFGFSNFPQRISNPAFPNLALARYTGLFDSV